MAVRCVGRECVCVRCARVCGVCVFVFSCVCVCVCVCVCARARAYAFMFVSVHLLLAVPRFVCLQRPPMIGTVSQYTCVTVTT
jgi:hypothetical protein